MTTTREAEIALQRACDEFVRRNVLHCMSQWVSEAQRAMGAAQDEGARGGPFQDWEEELQALSGRSGWECQSCGHFEVDEEEFESDVPSGSVDVGNGAPSQEGPWYSCPNCGKRSNDPDDVYLETTQEVYEHWAVDSWFATDLEKAGEIVQQVCDTWGRQTTGQAIAMDGVIRDMVKARRKGAS